MNFILEQLRHLPASRANMDAVIAEADRLSELLRRVRAECMRVDDAEKVQKTVFNLVVDFGDPVA